MDSVEDDPRRDRLRTVFDRAAEDYQRTRPVCPPQLFDELMDLAGLGAGDRVLEIGCGTGQATVPLAERGLAVTAVELGAGLAAIARRRLAGFPAAEVVTSAFEDWTPPSTPFDAVVAVSSLHWIDPRLRYRKPHGLLRPGGPWPWPGACGHGLPTPNASGRTCRRTTGPWVTAAARRHHPNRSACGTSRPRRGASSSRSRAEATRSSFATAPGITSLSWPRSPAPTASARPGGPNSSPASGTASSHSAGPG